MISYERNHHTISNNIYVVPAQVNLTHSSLLPNLTTEGECVTFTCTVVLGPGLVESDLSLIEVDAVLYRDGAPLALSGPTAVTDTTLTYSTQLDLSVRNITENYTCMTTVRPREELAFISTSTSMSNLLTIESNGKEFIKHAAGKCHETELSSTGVYISLRGKTYPQNSNILITDIGEGDSDALICHTDLAQCCRLHQTINGSRLGEWFYPDASTVNNQVSSETFYRSRDSSVVLLHRRGSTTSPTGQFCCEVPDASYALITTCINLGELDFIWHGQHTIVYTQHIYSDRSLHDIFS